MNQPRMTALLCGAISAMFLAGCGSRDTSNATVGGSVTGLAAGTTVTLVDNGADSLPVSANGNFLMAGHFSSNDSYNVTVSTQPTGQNCLVSNGSGLINYAGDDVNNVMVSCQPNVPVSVVVSGLPSGSNVTPQLMLQNDPNDTYPKPLTSVSNGTYTFPVLLTLGEIYSVIVAVQPALPYVCAVSGDYSGGVVGSTPIQLSITCAVPS